MSPAMWMVATLLSKTGDGIAQVFRFEVDSDELANDIIPKGSVAVSGVSLTVNTIENRFFAVALIPHTISHTNLEDLGVGQSVNIETDLLGKYVKKFLSPVLNSSESSNITMAFLADHGFSPVMH